MLKKNIKFIKNETESKMENPTHNFIETNLKNHKLKVKLAWVGACERKNRAFCATFILYFISMYSVLITLSEYIYICFYISKNIAS